MFVSALCAAKVYREAYPGIFFSVNGGKVVTECGFLSVDWFFNFELPVERLNKLI
jgi:hypothetical protein